MSLIFAKLASAAGGSEFAATTVFAVTTDGLSAYNVADTANISHISTLSDANFREYPIAYSHKRKHVYFTSGSSIVSVDVSNPSSMSVSSSVSGVGHGIALDDNNDVLYVSTFSGVISIDVSDPSNMVQIDSRSYASRVSSDIVLDLKNNRALVVLSGSTDYILFLISINGSGTLSASLDSFQSQTGQTTSGRECLALDVDGKRCFMNTFAYGYIIDYSGDTLTSLNEAAVFEGRNEDRLHYVKKDKVVFSSEDANAWDLSSVNSKALLSSNLSINEYKAFDDFRSVAFGTINNALGDDAIVAIDVSDASNPSTISSLNDPNINLATSMVPNTNGPSATFAYK